MPTGIVTGASRGLGLALVRSLSDRGWKVVVDARGEGALRLAVRDLPGVVAVPGSVADPRHRAALIAAAGERIDLLVNNASLLGPSPQPALAGYPLLDLRRGFEGNVVAPPALAPLALPRLAHGAGGVTVPSRP